MCENGQALTLIFIKEVTAILKNQIVGFILLEVNPVFYI